MDEAAAGLVGCFCSNGKLLLFGNSGSDPGAELMAAELVGGRDSTLISDLRYLSDPRHPCGMQCLPGAAEASWALREAGHRLARISNQSAIDEFHLNLAAAFMVGHAPIDVDAGRADCNTTLFNAHHTDDAPAAESGAPD